jgi:hypothetical protein
MNTKNIVLGIDPGAKTGVATFIDGSLHQIQTLTHQDLLKLLVDGTINGKVTAVIFEDSTKQKHVWHRTGLTAPAMMRVARNVGMVDEMCRNIVRVCSEQGIPAVAVSPLGKGAKLSAEVFKKRIGWQPRTSQHGRDAAMVYFASSIGRLQGKQTFEVIK